MQECNAFYVFNFRISARVAPPGTLDDIKGDLQIGCDYLYFVDFNYINNYKNKEIMARGFSRDFATDTTQAMRLQ